MKEGSGGEVFRKLLPAEMGFTQREESGGSEVLALSKDRENQLRGCISPAVDF